MAARGATVHDTLGVPGSSAGDVSARVAATLEDTGSYQVVEVGPAQHQVVRIYRPTWALVAGALLLPLFGLGLLLLLVRRTESCTVGIVHGSTGLVVSIDGELLPQHLDAVRRVALEEQRGPARAQRSESSTPLRVSAQPAPGEGAVAAEVTVTRAPHAAPAERLALRLADGRCLPLVGRVLIGRDPAPSATGQGPETLVPIDDPARSLSKTHLLVRAEGGRVVVEDLHSTNGTGVSLPDGTRRSLSPGEPARLAAGSRLHFGAHVAEVVASG